ncbi:hypothetical protein UFOVP583_28 [uncultured Caudovirales phage]|uniref:Uncharacterized protein n=1 Tax=uncultured Caudovirales phage TaxID=2100421 RepID=A0A6J5MYM0_9CAUD|nr:hypothetical protein UFOVP583_28 [uncultured Caudovirales phage]
MSRFQAIGNYVYEKGERIGCTLDEAADVVACKLNAYQMRIERLKAEVDALRKELAEAQENYHLVNEMVARLRKERKPSV